MIRGLLFLSLVLLAVRGGFVFASPIIKNTLFEAKMQDLASTRGLKSEADLRSEVRDYIQEKQIDVTPEEIFLEMTERGCLIAAHYTTEATFLKLTRSYEFYPASSETARNKSKTHFRFAAMTRR